MSGVMTWPMAYVHGSRSVRLPRETAPGTTRERQMSARAQTAHNVEPRGEFYGDRAGRDMCFARARDADSANISTDYRYRNNMNHNRAKFITSTVAYTSSAQQSARWSQLTRAWPEAHNQVSRVLRACMRL